MFTLICANNKDAGEVESDLRYLYFLDEDPPFLKWTRSNNRFCVYNDKDGYAKKYLLKKHRKVI
jgi:hypothetical protein